jgi:hypothetical protein
MMTKMKDGWLIGVDGFQMLGERLANRIGNESEVEAGLVSEVASLRRLIWCDRTRRAAQAVEI